MIGSLDNDDYMKILKGFNFRKTHIYWRDDLIKMNKSPYILEQNLYACWIFPSEKYENDNLFILRKYLAINLRFMSMIKI